jgi:uncharacterized membrane protein YeaQ/YmgE (transglycosylase-associated protein family)
MNTWSLILFLVIGLVAGWLAGQVLKGKGFGLIGDLIVGVIGAFLGGWLFSLLKISIGGILGSLITAFVGAVVFLYVIRIIKKV